MVRYYTICYRRTNLSSETLLLVADERGILHLFAGGHLRQRLASDVVMGWLTRDTRWIRVPTVAPYTVDELCCLTARPATGNAVSMAWGRDDNGRSRHRLVTPSSITRCAPVANRACS